MSKTSEELMNIPDSVGVMVESKFTVLESYIYDIGRSVICIDKNKMDDLNIVSGDIVKIMAIQDPNY